MKLLPVLVHQCPECSAAWLCNEACETGMHECPQCECWNVGTKIMYELKK